jgi:hypothetical protein
MRTSRRIETQNRSPVMANDKEGIQNAKHERLYREEVHGCDRLAMIAKERQPGFGRIKNYLILKA